jgi:hypothetical protein
LRPSTWKLREEDSNQSVFAMSLPIYHPKKPNTTQRNRDLR